MFCTKYCLLSARKSGKGTKHVLELGVYFPGASPDLGSIKKSKSCAPESEIWSIIVSFACGSPSRRANDEFISKSRVEFIFYLRFERYSMMVGNGKVNWALPGTMMVLILDGIFWMY